MNNEELDSQLSAMFDDELPGPECELLARRLARDEGLKARWGRYAVIGACMRMERGGATGDARPGHGESRVPPIRLNGDLASRVSKMIAEEPALLAGSAVSRSVRRLANPAIGRWWQAVGGGAAVATAVAASAILWLRAGSPDAPIVAQNPMVAVTTNGSAAPLAASRMVQAGVPAAAGLRRTAVRSKAASPDSFVVPPAAPAASFAPPIELANFVVAHSEYSMPLMRHSALSALVAEEPRTDDGATSTAQGDAAANAGAPDRSDTSHADSPR